MMFGAHQGLVKMEAAAAAGGAVGNGANGQAWPHVPMQHFAATHAAAAAAGLAMSAASAAAPQPNITQAEAEAIG